MKIVQPGHGRAATLQQLGGVFLLSTLAGHIPTSAVAADAVRIPEIVVTATRAPYEPTAGERPNAPLAASTLVLNADQMPEGADRLEDVLTAAGAATSTAGAAGLGTGINLRGFDAGGRLFVNGQPDIQRLYVRDLATVESVEILKGHSSVLYGQGAPGGTINYNLKQPSGASRSELRFALDNYGLSRVVLDLDRPLGQSAARLVYAGQGGGTFIDKVDNQRQAALLSVRHAYRGGIIRWELEHQRNERPFGFGTVFAAGRFWFDRYYLAPATRSVRQYSRQAVYLDQQLTGRWSVHAGLSFAQVNRRETLAGFWTVESDTELSSYYRKLQDDVDQANLKVELRGRHDWLGMGNETTIGYQQDRQAIDFQGPQNIGAFTIDIAHPDFNRDWAALPLSPRETHERYRESGLYWFDQLQASESVRLLAGLRASALRIEAGKAGPLAMQADLRHMSSVGGVVWNPQPVLTLHLTRSESFEPNRGLTRDGDFLLPRPGRQWETGVGYEGDHAGLKLALFKLRQSNLTAPDPADRTALINIGTIGVRGVETRAEWRGGPFAMQADVAWQHARNEVKPSNALGQNMVNVPAMYGALRLDWRAAPDWALWGALRAVGRRAGDAENSFSAPGYAALDAGARYRIDAGTTLALEVGNVADRRYVAALTGADDVYQGERRRLVASVRHRF
jgi:iron complex outermembrane recepter protein